jgi:hypothetical protein
VTGTNPAFPTEHVVICARFVSVERSEQTFQHSAAFVFLFCRW